MLHFDKQGHLTPYKAISVNFETFADTFTWNLHRIALFDAYTAYMNELMQLSLGAFTQWINGSFVTKHSQPHDIDVVTFLDHVIADRNMKTLDSLKVAYQPQGVDIFYVKTYPDDHRFRKRYDFDRTEWLFLYTQNRKKQPKGFLELTFQSDAT